MSTYKNIEKMGLDLLYAYQCDKKATVIYAEDLESILQSAQVVYGCPEGLFRTTGKPNEVDTHRALLLCVEPIKKKTKAEAALELLEIIAKDPAYYSSLGAAQAKRILQMKDEE